MGSSGKGFAARVVAKRRRVVRVLFGDLRRNDIVCCRLFTKIERGSTISEGRVGSSSSSSYN